MDWISGWLEVALSIFPKALPGVYPGPFTWTCRISNLAKVPPYVFYHPLWLGLPRALRSLFQHGVQRSFVWAWWFCGSPWSCCQPSHLCLFAGAAHLVQFWPVPWPLPAASSPMVSLPLHPTWLMFIALLFFPLITSNCMSFLQLNSNQYTFCISQGSLGKQSQYIEIFYRELAHMIMEAEKFKSRRTNGIFPVWVQDWRQEKTHSPAPIQRILLLCLFILFRA